MVVVVVVIVVVWIILPGSLQERDLVAYVRCGRSGCFLEGL